MVEWFSATAVKVVTPVMGPWVRIPLLIFNWFGSSEAEQDAVNIEVEISKFSQIANCGVVSSW